MIARPRIRPLGLGELLDESFRLYRRCFTTLVAIAALVLVPYALLSLIAQLPFQQQIEEIQQQASSGVDPLAEQSLWSFFGGLLFTIFGSIAISLVYTILLQPLMQGALARSVSQAYLDHEVSIGDGFRSAWRHILGLIGGRLIPALLWTLAIGLSLALSLGSVALLGGISPAQSGSPSLGRLGTGLLAVFCLLGLLAVVGLVGLMVFVRLIFTVQAVVIEGRGPWSGITRSWRLTGGYFWRTLGYVLVIALLVYIIGAVPALVVTVPLQLLMPDQLRLQAVVNTVVSAVLNVFVTPFGLIAYTLMYYDLRIRKEGFDMEQHPTLMQLAGAEPSA